MVSATLIRTFQRSLLAQSAKAVGHSPAGTGGSNLRQFFRYYLVIGTVFGGCSLVYYNAFTANNKMQHIFKDERTKLGENAKHSL